MSDRTRNERENRHGWELEHRLRNSNVPVRAGEDRQVSEGTERVPSQPETIRQFAATQKSLNLLTVNTKGKSFPQGPSGHQVNIKVALFY